MVLSEIMSLYDLPREETSAARQFQVLEEKKSEKTPEEAPPTSLLQIHKFQSAVFKAGGQATTRIHLRELSQVLGKEERLRK